MWFRQHSFASKMTLKSAFGLYGTCVVHCWMYKRSATRFEISHMPFFYSNNSLLSSHHSCRWSMTAKNTRAPIADEIRLINFKPCANSNRGIPYKINNVIDKHVKCFRLLNMHGTTLQADRWCQFLSSFAVYSILSWLNGPSQNHVDSLMFFHVQIHVYCCTWPSQIVLKSLELLQLLCYYIIEKNLN